LPFIVISFFDKYAKVPTHEKKTPQPRVNQKLDNNNNGLQAKSAKKQEFFIFLPL